MVVSWMTDAPVRRPRVRLGLDDGFGETIAAETRTYVDAASGVEVYTHHARLDNLQPASTYVYQALNESGGDPVGGRFSTPPRRRARLRFTSFGDQATPVPPNGMWSLASSYAPPQIEQLQPLFHLLNGDLSYANISPDRVKAWRDFFLNNQISTRNRPWMPCAGNHENELGNGPFGYLAYQTRYTLPGNGESDPALRGMWYTFKTGSVRVISLNNDDVCYQDAGDSYIRGYSGGAQKRFLERTLAAARADEETDWIVVCMHQVAISSARGCNGADLGVREEWLPLFDKYGVDLVVCGHEHHFERSRAVRGVDADSPTLRPHAVDDRLVVIDTTRGTVHMVIGCGGASAATNHLFTNPAICDVVVSVGKQASVTPGEPRPRRAATRVTEAATWVGTRNAQHPYGFASFDVDPGVPGGKTRIHVTVWNTAQCVGGTPALFDQFTLERPRSDWYSAPSLAARAERRAQRLAQ